MSKREELIKLFKSGFYDLNLHTDEELEQMSIEELEMIAIYCMYNKKYKEMI